MKKKKNIFYFNLIIHSHVIQILGLNDSYLHDKKTWIYGSIPITNHITTYLPCPLLTSHVVTSHVVSHV